jgi:4-hydroxythreonine-4-phosphate dehydrogenase
MQPLNKRIAITIGDLNGIGPEIVVKALYDSLIRLQGRFVIYGTENALRKAAKQCSIEPFWNVAKPGRFDFNSDSQVALLDYGYSNVYGLREPNEESGRASLAFCKDAIRDALAGRVSAIVTAPIHKISWDMAGAKWPGHTEMLAELTGTKECAMMFVAGKMRLALATIHCPLSEVPSRLTIAGLCSTIELMNRALVRYFGIDKPRIAVSGLNPHAGEDGKFGDEEIRIIKPAIVFSRENGINASGAYPADTLFTAKSRAKYDAVIVMYHDQGLIPLKALSMNDATNVTIGLPIIRTSPAHGTAMDMAGKGIADESSMKMAIRVAAMMAERKAEVI